MIHNGMFATTGGLLGNVKVKGVYLLVGTIVVTIGVPVNGAITKGNIILAGALISNGSGGETGFIGEPVFIQLLETKTTSHGQRDLRGGVCAGTTGL